VVAKNNAQLAERIAQIAREFGMEIVNQTEKERIMIV
jgi:uncharacterized protein (DUF849 family)